MADSPLFGRLETSQYFDGSARRFLCRWRWYTNELPTNENRTGYGTHGDYIFGWKGDSLQRAMDSPCYVNCPTLKTQSISAMNKCAVARTVEENIDGCKLNCFATCLVHSIADDKSAGLDHIPGLEHLQL